MTGLNCIKWLFFLNLILAFIQTVHLRPLTESEGESKSPKVTDSERESRGHLPNM
jgi:hypothetical protein